MNHFVPEFETDDDFVNVTPNSSSLNLPRKPILNEDDELMELLWHNGQVVLQNQRLNNTKKPSSSSSSVKLHVGGGEANSSSLDQNLFIQEDEMTSWLLNPLREDDFCSDLLFSASTHPPTAPSAATSDTQTTTTHVTAARPPVPSVRPKVISSRPPVRNFMNFSRLRGNVRDTSTPSIVRESTQVTPTSIPSSAAVASQSSLTRGKEAIESVNCGSSSAVAGGSAYTLAVSGPNQKGKAVATTAPASDTPGTSSSVAPKNEHGQPIDEERKRKEREDTGETECRSEETKQGRGGGSSTSTKRSRAAEVHNLSERKRRDRINERMKALQQLIPRCNKSDKASMLDEAIEYMKSLQLQVQMMSMGCGMMPMMYPGMQQYMPHMAAMGMGMNHPPPPPSFMPFPNMLAAQRPLSTPTHMVGSGPHYPVHASDPSRVFVPNQQCDPNSSQPQFPGYMDPYQQFRSLLPTQPAEFQNQATSYPSSSRVSSSKESEDQGNHNTG